MKFNILISSSIILFLCNCGIGPKYYDKYQNIELNNINNNSKVYFNEVSQPLKTKGYIVEVPRRSSNQKLLIEENGEFSEIILKSSITDEKWATQYGGEVFPHVGKSQNYSAGYLLLPTNTYIGIRMIPSFLEESGETLFKGQVVSSLTWFGAAVIAIPCGLIVDVYNIVIGLPSTAIINPWYKYTIEQQKLKPIYETTFIKS